MRINLNFDWNFYFDKDAEQAEVVSFPHTVKETPYDYFSEDIYQTISRYEKFVTIDQSWLSKSIVLHFDGVAHEAKMLVNDTFVMEHRCGYTAFEADISELLKEGENKLELIVDSHETLNQPPFGNVIDYMTYGGVYRGAWIEIKEKAHIADVYHRFSEISGQEFLETKAWITDTTDDYKLQIVLYNQEHMEEQVFSPETNVDSDEEKCLSCIVKLENIHRWNLNHPDLYYVETRLVKNEVTVDNYERRIGFRIVDWRADGFYLNGQKIKLRGINRHQSYPYVGYAMPARPQRMDAIIIKKELGMNAVRTSHYPQSHDFIDCCDEIGLLVFTEIPGWQHIGDDEWKKEAIQNVYEMVTQYRHHPSIVLWGVRINESMDDEKFYTETNALTHRLIPGEFTGGVRFLQKSQLLEDVYTYNDFLHNGKTKGASMKKEVTSDMTKAYLVSEYNGHMFPTKQQDCEEHRLEHALRHATVLNEISKQEDIAGSFGWCMFDYNTHKDFGSGDRICYHGIMDMFRNRKMAAAVYSSQSEESPVFEISSSMDIGEHPAAMGDVFVFTNADSVRMYKNGLFIKEFHPNPKGYGSLTHPPIPLDDFVGELLVSQEGFDEKTAEQVKKLLAAIAKYGQNNLPLKYMLLAAKLMVINKMTFQRGFELYGKYVGGWGDKVRVYKFEAIKDGKVVQTIERSPMETIHLDITVDTHQLEEKETYDVASIRIIARDQNGNMLNPCNETIELECEGAIKIIGPKNITLRGGSTGTYVRTIGEAGEGKLTVIFRGEREEIAFTVAK